MADPKREELLASAVKFLQDPNVQSSPLAKKVAFLESKGLTADEIEVAMARASGKALAPPAGVLPQGTLPQGAYPPGAVVLQGPPVPPRPRYDWRDLFIAAVMAGGVGYGLWLLVKQYVAPLVQIPTQKDLEEDKQLLDAQFQAAEDALRALGEQTSSALHTVTRQSEKVSQTLEVVDDTLREIKERETTRDEEMRTIKGDVDIIKGLIPKMLDRNRDAQTTILNDLQNEVKSLKSLLLSRRGGPGGLPLSEATTAVEPTPNTSSLSTRLTATLASATRPGIPPWQKKEASTTSGAGAALVNGNGPVLMTAQAQEGREGGITTMEMSQELVGVEKVDVEGVENQ
ncbi:peroxisomal membrane anchor protein conserved region-domain-containing protein [Endogone sp. FLAS-F59071]|nr:peroxisomal membrane anchor protein conserved region-domain-containing protein [Endogone sp. FLAS-F59071]|eukprot:RUS15381.1 peroxisomal membrane anchor protein conserved region-domain-containing protein [Endogone sp. FLAS-F59071]